MLALYPKIHHAYFLIDLRLKEHLISIVLFHGTVDGFFVVDQSLVQVLLENGIKVKSF